MSHEAYLAHDRKLLPTQAQMQQINNLCYFHTLKSLAVKMDEYQCKKISNCFK